MLDAAHTMKTSPAGIVALVGEEGIVPAPYLDSVGIWTWGVGHTAAAGAPIPAQMPRGMPADLDAALDEIFTVLKADLESYEDDVREAVKVPVQQHEFDALLAFHYNTGAVARATLTHYLNKGDRARAGECFMNWCRPKELEARRKKERAMFEKGVYSSDRLTVWSVNASGKVTWRIAKKLSPDEILQRMQGWLSDAPVRREKAQDEGFQETDFKTGMPILAAGARGPNVATLHALLGLPASLPDVFGPRTASALRAFQKSAGLVVDAICGPASWAALTKGT